MKVQSKYEGVKIKIIFLTSSMLKGGEYVKRRRFSTVYRHREVL